MNSHELDLIPASYRERIKIKRWCLQFLWALACLILAIVVAKFVIEWQTDNYQSRLSTLQTEKSFNLRQQQQYNTLLIKQQQLQKKLEILNALKAGPAVSQILQAIDRVLDGRVWFSRWTFQRAGEMKSVTLQKQQTGYFIIIPQDISGNIQQQTWELNTHMTIEGQAFDFSTLSDFVNRLLKQPEIEDVKVIKTILNKTSEGQLVNFTLVVTINNNLPSRHDL